MKAQQIKPAKVMMRNGFANFYTSNESLSKTALISLMTKLLTEFDTFKHMKLNEVFDLNLGKNFKHRIGLSKKFNLDSLDSERITFNFNPKMFEELVKNNDLDSRSSNLKNFSAVANSLDGIYRKMYNEAIMVARSLDSTNPNLQFEELIHDNNNLDFSPHYLSLTLYCKTDNKSVCLTNEHVDESLFTVHGWDVGSRLRIKTDNGIYERCAEKNKALAYFGSRAKIVCTKELHDAEAIENIPEIVPVRHEVSDRTKKVVSPCASLQFYAMCKV